MSEYIVKLPTYGAADEFFKTHEMPDMTLYGYPLTGEIVRCCDCKYADETESGLLLCNGYLVESWDWYNDMPNDGMEVKPDGFCAWGERRGDAE